MPRHGKGITPRDGEHLLGRVNPADAGMGHSCPGEKEAPSYNPVDAREPDVPPQRGGRASNSELRTSNMNGQNPKSYILEIPEAHEMDRLLSEIRRAGATVRELPSPPAMPTGEGEAFKDPLGTEYDSWASMKIARWSNLAFGFRQNPNLLRKFMEELRQNPHEEVRTVNFGRMKGKATALILQDNSRLLAVHLDPEEDFFMLYRLIGEVRRNGEYWRDWGYDPPVATLQVPLPGNQNPPIPSSP